MFKLPVEERLHSWRNFRRQLGTKPLDQALVEVVDFWRPCPFSPYYLDPDSPSEWPDPWTLIGENWYCDLAKAVGMLYSIKFTDHDPLVEIKVYRDNTTGYRYNLVWVENGKYILNLVDGEVSTKECVNQDWTLLFEFNSLEY